MGWLAILFLKEWGVIYDHICALTFLNSARGRGIYVFDYKTNYKLLTVPV